MSAVLTNSAMHTNNTLVSRSIVKDAIYDYLYDPVMTDFGNRLVGIVDENSALHGNEQRCFTYRGHLYTRDPHWIDSKPLNRLHPSLYDEMNRFLKDKDDLKTGEQPYVNGYLNQVLNISKTMEDCLELLPSGVHKPVYDFIDRWGTASVTLDAGIIERFLKRNQLPLQMLKQRLLLNLLVQ